MRSASGAICKAHPGRLILTHLEEGHEKTGFLFGTICALVLAQPSFAAAHNKGTVTYIPDVTFTSCHVNRGTFFVASLSIATACQ
jgi:hypothetical protein